MRNAGQRTGAQVRGLSGAQAGHTSNLRSTCEAPGTRPQAELSRTMTPGPRLGESRLGGIRAHRTSSDPACGLAGRRSQRGCWADHLLRDAPVLPGHRRCGAGPTRSPLASHEVEMRKAHPGAASGPWEELRHPKSALDRLWMDHPRKQTVTQRDTADRPAPWHPTQRGSAPGSPRLSRGSLPPGTTKHRGSPEPTPAASLPPATHVVRESPLRAARGRAEGAPGGSAGEDGVPGPGATGRTEAAEP